MLKNYLKLTFRNLFRNKVYSFINVAGLAIGITGSLLILVYVANQFSFESIHKNRQHIVRVSVRFGSGEGSMTLAGAMSALGPAATKEIPEVKTDVRFAVDRNAKIRVGDREFVEHRFFFADSNVFEVFTFPLIRGDRKTALQDPSSIVITRSIATKYFGKTNPVGKTLLYNDKYEFIVSGVMEDVPANTQLRCDFIAPYAREMAIKQAGLSWTSWGETYTYLYLNSGATLVRLKQNLNDLLTEHTNEHFAALLQFEVLPLTDIYFKSDMRGELGPTGDLNSAYLFSSIAILVLLIACLNFINLSTAQSLRRLKEVGLRKVLGAQRPSLILQFFGESLFITLIGVILSLILFTLFNPLLHHYLNIQAGIQPLETPQFYFILVGIILFTSLIAGVYPAIYLSTIQPVDSLRSTKTPGSSTSLLRRILVVAQFTIAVFLIIGTFVIYRQLHYMRNSDPGFDKSDVLVVDYPISKAGMQDKYPVIKQAFRSVPGVLAVSGAYTLPGVNNKETQSIHISGKPEDDYSIIQAIGVDYNFVSTLGLHLLKGRDFSEKYTTDRSHAIILNESAVKSLGLQNPVGTEVNLPSGEAGKQKAATIIGVVRDFHVTSFHHTIEPMFLYINPVRFYSIALKTIAGKRAGIMGMLKERWKQILPDSEFSVTTLSQNYDDLYLSDARNGKLFSIFATLAIAVACMGLFGLISYTIETRVKEIGIRKVLGANFVNIILLLSKDLLSWVLVANFIAWPIAWFAATRWLENFAYRVEMALWPFLVSGSVALTIALLTLSWQAVRAANADPVESLRYE